MAWCNLSEILRMIKKVDSDAPADDNHHKFFNNGNKDLLVQKICAAIISNNANAGYLRLAKDFDYNAADEFEEANLEDVTMDESNAKNYPGRGKCINKTNSVCKNCKGIRH